MTFTYTRKGKHSVPADVAGAELLRIRDEYDGLETQTVVDEAERQSSPIHDCFEWDDTAAAGEHRKWQARQLIRSIVIEREEGETSPVFVNVKVDGKQFYQSVSVAVTRPDEWASAREGLISKLMGIQKALDDLDGAESIKLDDPRRMKIRRVREHIESASEHARQL